MPHIEELLHEQSVGVQVPPGQAAEVCVVQVEEVLGHTGGSAALTVLHQTQPQRISLSRQQTFCNPQTHTIYIYLHSPSKNTAALLNTKHRGPGLTPTSEFVMQRFSELTVQVDQTACCTRFSLKPRVTLQITETNKTPIVNFSIKNSHFHVSTKRNRGICCFFPVLGL